MKILLLGEGDFSFTFALDRQLCEGRLEAVSQLLNATSLTTSDRVDLIATSLDSKQEVLNKYPSFAFAVRKCEYVSVHHGVNALDGESLKLIVPDPDVIVWNHPHLGYEDCDRHFQLLVHFFHEMKSVFSSRIILSCLADQVTRWRVIEAGTRCGYRPTAAWGLNETDFPGYACKRNLSGDSFKSARARSNWSSASLSSHFIRFELQGEAIDISQYFSSVSQEFPPEVESIQCAVCRKSFGSEQGLRTHRRQVHELRLYKSAEVACGDCGKLFASIDALDLHSRNAHGGLDVRSSSSKRPRLGDDSCSVCGSREVNHLAEFGRNRIFEIKKCSHCDKEFKSERALNQHLNVVHP